MVLNLHGEGSTSFDFGSEHELFVKKNLIASNIRKQSHANIIILVHVCKVYSVLHKKKHKTPNVNLIKPVFWKVLRPR